jgi:hypothetical protein
VATFVHVAPVSREGAIRRAGLSGTKGPWRRHYRDGGPVYAFPQLESYTLTHQWTREMMKWRRARLIAVRFRLPDAEIVEFFHYRGAPVRMAAAEAVAAARAAEDPRGMQVIVQRRVRGGEITAIAPLRGVTGWRHFPDAHGRRPCGCPACCTRGEPASVKIRARWERDDREWALAQDADHGMG